MQAAEQSRQTHLRASGMRPDSAATATSALAPRRRAAASLSCAQTGYASELSLSGVQPPMDLGMGKGAQAQHSSSGQGGAGREHRA